VHELVEGVGGYWRPIAGVTRVMEELGELSEETESAGAEGDTAGIANELADLWIISTAVANLFNIEVEPFASRPGHQPRRELGRLVQHAGRMARIVNYYDGPKTPRSFEGWATLASVIRDFQAEVYLLAHAYELSLDQAIDRKISRTVHLDRGRFSTGFNPSTSKTLEHFEQVRADSRCPFASTARLWGGPQWNTGKPIGYNVDTQMPYLITFAKAAVPEGLDGFVIELGSPARPTFQRLVKQFGQLLRLLAARDSRPNPSFQHPVEVPGWQFSLYGMPMFVSVFSALYPAHHPRHAPRGTFVLLQPEESFDTHGIGGGRPRTEALKQQVRQRFAAAGQDYATEMIGRRLEACIYLLPQRLTDEPVRWWENDQPTGQLTLPFEAG